MSSSDLARTAEAQRVRMFRRLLIAGIAGTAAGLTLVVLASIGGAPVLVAVGAVMAVLQIGVIVLSLVAFRAPAPGA